MSSLPTDNTSGRTISACYMCKTERMHKPPCSAQAKCHTSCDMGNRCNVISSPRSMPKFAHPCKKVNHRPKIIAGQLSPTRWRTATRGNQGRVCPLSCGTSETHTAVLQQEQTGQSQPCWKSWQRVRNCSRRQ